MNEILLKRITELREEKDISQRQLQKELGLSPSTITKWKTSNPSATTLQAVADYFDVSTDYLTGKTKYRNTEHMLQSFDLNFKPDMTNADIPVDCCIQTDEGIVLIEAKTAAPKYIDPDTRRIAEKIMDDAKLRQMFEIIERVPQHKFDALYNMIVAMDNV